MPHFNILGCRAIPPRPRRGEDAEAKSDHEDREGMTGEQASQYRALLVQYNFLGSVVPDLHFSAKEASTPMAAPHVGDMRHLRARSPSV